MTWFGTALVIYWVLNILAAMWVAGRGGIWYTAGSAVLSAAISITFIILLFTVGVGV